VDLALRSGDIARIYGPPGTGKTRTLVEVVRQRIARGERVLCAAPSNTAVDNLGIRLAMLDRSPAGGARVVRLGHPARIHPKLATLTIDAQVDTDGASKLAREWRDRARALRKTAAGRHGAEAKALWTEARSLDRDAARAGECGARDRRTRERRARDVRRLRSPVARRDRVRCVVVDEATQAPIAAADRARSREGRSARG
jgi:DNA polymerase alpha-associated DNA helicase A